MLGRDPLSKHPSCTCTGYINLPGPGQAAQVWTFALKSDDGSQLYIDDQLVIDYGGAALLGMLLNCGYVCVSDKRLCCTLQNQSTAAFMRVIVVFPAALASQQCSKAVVAF